MWGSGGAEERRDGAAVRKGSDRAGQCPTHPRWLRFLPAGIWCVLPLAVMVMRRQ